MTDQQTGREVGEPDGYTSYGEFRWAADCDERMRREWLPLYTAAPKQQAVEVTEEMVRRALHFCPSEQSSPQKWRWIAKFITSELLAALPGKTEVE